MKYTFEYQPAPVIRDYHINSPESFPESFYKEIFPQHEFEERMWAVYLNNAKKVITAEMVGQGDLSSCSINSMKVYRSAILLAATGVILIHNHPSNNKRMSLADKSITQLIGKGLKAVNSRLYDHLIYTRDGVVSLASEGILHDC